MEDIIQSFRHSGRGLAVAYSPQIAWLVPVLVLVGTALVLLAVLPFSARPSFAASTSTVSAGNAPSGTSDFSRTVDGLADPARPFRGTEGEYAAAQAIASATDAQGNLPAVDSVRVGDGGAGWHVVTSSLAAGLYNDRPAATDVPPIEYRTVDDDSAFSTFLPFVVGSNASSPAPVKDAVLIPLGSQWKFLDDGSSPPVAWSDPAFDDSGWKEGGAKLGYGDKDVTTQVSFGHDEKSKHITSYFRHTFIVEDPGAYKMLDLRLRRDDGAVVYLNGHEVFRSNMPDGPVTSDTLALTGVSDGAAEESMYQRSVVAQLLIEGRNVLAAEVHQRSPASSDLAFDLALLATVRDALRFAAIGDYGVGMGQVDGGYPALDVANLVKSWSPDLVVTLGDNNYLNGLREETWGGRTEGIDDRIGQFFGEFISPYRGKYTGGTGQNRFFPSLGNHDWNCAYLDDPELNCGALPHPYLDYFTLPGNERYYEFTEGPVHFFVLDTDDRPQNDLDEQKVWLGQRMPKAQEPWKVVYFHHPPYDLGGSHRERTDMRWDFEQWGVSAILAGHDHLYNRQIVAGIPYFVNGLGGMTRYECALNAQGSQVSPYCYDDDFGAMLVVADDCDIRFDFVNRVDELIDSYALSRCK